MKYFIDNAYQCMAKQVLIKVCCCCCHYLYKNREYYLWVLCSRGKWPREMDSELWIWDINIWMVLYSFTQLSTVPVFSCYNNHCITNKPKFLSVQISCVPLLVLAGLICIFVVAVKCWFGMGSLIWWKVGLLLTGI